jgi:ankyrin repeat protein
MLIASKYPLDFVTKRGETAVAIAAKNGNLRIIKALINAGADFNRTDKDGIGPLYLSILHNHEKCSEFLIHSGAQFYYDSLHERDLSPIFLAIRKENTKILEILCDHNASMVVKDSEGRTPLMFASAKGYNEIVNYLSLRSNDLN